ncbi:hypothetical protein EST38_g6121 [Candolleomyces aberdarensis]|uniref:Nephrocystin 3-like N-terminal domain-containing protein n=1 Tax=Candolleomyces aberdarensis TaxID=2316362 RepID=A0A4Q2DIU4_9AGAR|nr:hypothetical protein EST38_g6121 [Candolleomyces aberdarensis]
MGDLHFIDANHVTVHPQTESVDGWQLLLAHTAPNALHNSHARYDTPKCDEDTRIEVTSEIMKEIENLDGPQRLLCMTGAAGAGKSALQQTIAEICGKKNILGSSFFFSATDPSRNTVSLVVPTIAYQLGRRSPGVKRLIKAAVEEDPLIFSQSLRDQMATLVMGPFERLGSEGLDFSTVPYTILIDGLDECRGEDSQAELLTAIKECLLFDHLPFRIFIASRPEWAIRTALAPGGHLHALAYHIQLSDKYDASGDMCRYLQRRFHALTSRTGNPQWFTQRDIDTLVEAASGQFVYVAVAFNYISERRASPAERLKIILTWTPHVGQIARPFEALDALYTNILLAAKKAYEAVDTHHGRDFLVLFRAHHINISGFQIHDITVGPSVELFSVLWLGLEAGAERGLFSDLRSLVTLERYADGNHSLRLYHKSFSDFLEGEIRAKDLFVPEARVHKHIAKCFMQRITDPMPDKWEELPFPDSPERSLKIAIELLPFFLSSAAAALDQEVADFTQNGGWPKIDNLLPLLYHRTGRCLPSETERWIGSLRRLIDIMKLRKPEVAAVINQFVDKWGGGRGRQNGMDLNAPGPRGRSLGFCRVGGKTPRREFP